MTVFVPPVFLIKKMKIIRALMKANAYSADSAKRVSGRVTRFITVRHTKNSTVRPINMMTTMRTPRSLERKYI